MRNFWLWIMFYFKFKRELDQLMVEMPEISSVVKMQIKKGIPSPRDSRDILIVLDSKIDRLIELLGR